MLPDGAGVTFAGVQTTHKIAGASASGYAAYLTSASDRGDYYLTSAGTGYGAGEDGGAGGGAQSRWHGSPQLLDSLGLHPGGPVGRDELLDLMNGVSPVTGEELRRAGANGTRVAGIDLTFSAPKSVSALWAVSGPGERELIERAHREAVASTIGRIEREVELVRGRVEGEVRHERAQECGGGRVRAHLQPVDARSGAGRGARPAAALPRGGARRGADGRALRGGGQPRAVPGGAGERGVVPGGARARAATSRGWRSKGRRGGVGAISRWRACRRSLSERWSARSVDIERAAARFRERYGRDPRAGELGDLTTSTRGTKGAVEQVDVNEAWRAVGAEHGLTREQAQGVCSPASTAALQQSLHGEQGT